MAAVAVAAVAVASHSPGAFRGGQVDPAVDGMVVQGRPGPEGRRRDTAELSVEMVGSRIVGWLLGSAALGVHPRLVTCVIPSHVRVLLCKV